MYGETSIKGINMCVNIMIGADYDVAPLNGREVSRYRFVRN